MKPDSFDVPILFIIFNRPDVTRRVFEEIKKIKPSKLYISADGPRDRVPSDKENCQKTRSIVKDIDWPCEVHTHFSNENKGCKIGVSFAITWFFEREAEGIILEDDCLPTPSFFSFCKVMLARYRSDESVMAVNGTNFLLEREIPDNSVPYHFSRCVHVWGWATWKRAWQKYDISVAHVSELGQIQKKKKLFSKNKYMAFWQKHCTHIHEKNIDTWDAQLEYSILYNQGLVVYPHVNLIENIGFSKNATHTTEQNPHILPTGTFANDVNDITKLKAPEKIEADTLADARLMDKVYMRSILTRILSKIF